MLNVVTIIIITAAELQQCLLQQEVALRLQLPFRLATQFIYCYFWKRECFVYVFQSGSIQDIYREEASKQPVGNPQL